MDGSPYPPADLHHGEDRLRGCHGKITRGKHTGGNFEPQSACAPGCEPNWALAELDCTILVDDDNKKYLLDSVNAAIYFRASVLNQGGMGDALFLKETP